MRERKTKRKEDTDTTKKVKKRHQAHKKDKVRLVNGSLGHLYWTMSTVTMPHLWITSLG